MGTCFVMQPFDGGPFDARYADLYDPAIRAAGLEPYRVDRDPSASIPVDRIEEGIRSALLCFADITLDNPNVWFELGFAIAARKQVVLVCSAERSTPFPFDVQHRKITRYRTEAPRDFNALADEITSRLNAIQSELTVNPEIEFSPIAPTEGLSQHELNALVAVAQRVDGPDDWVSAYIAREEMRSLGFADVAVTLGMRGLTQKGLIETFKVEDDRGEAFTAFRPLEAGYQWLQDHESLLALKHPPAGGQTVDVDDIPF